MNEKLREMKKRRAEPKERRTIRDLDLTVSHLWSDQNDKNKVFTSFFMSFMRFIDQWPVRIFTFVQSYLSKRYDGLSQGNQPIILVVDKNPPMEPLCGISFS